MASKMNLAIEAFKHKGFIRKLPDMVRMMKAVFRKEYTPEVKNMLIPGALLLYVISPIDVIPDWIPVIGEMDDLALVALAIPLLIKETERFVAWEADHKNGNGQIMDAEVVS